MTTIVQKTSQQIKTLSKVLHSAKVRIIALNKVDSKTKHYGYGESHTTKGVQSDHIKVFKMPSGHSSFAFAYNHIGLDNPTVSAIFEKNKKSCSGIFSEPEFREKLNQFVVLVQNLEKNSKLTESSLVNLFMSTFVNENKYNPEEDFKKAVKQIKQDLEKVEAVEAVAVKEKNRLHDLVKKTDQEIKKEISNLKKELGYSSLSKKYHEAVNKISALEKKLSKDKNMLGKMLKLSVAKDAVAQCEKDKESAIIQGCALVPRQFHKGIKDAIKKNKK